MRALAVERCDAVVARGAVVAGCAGAVVDVLAAVVARPAVHAHAVEAAHRVVTRAAVLAGVRRELALVYVFRAVLTCVEVTRQSNASSVRTKMDLSRPLFFSRTATSGTRELPPSAKL